MVNEQDRRWRERMRRDDDDRRYGEHRAGQHAGRGWREGSEWRNRDRGGEWSGAGGSRGYGGRGGGWGDRDRSDRPSGSAWEQSGWDDPGRGDMRRREMGQDLESRGDYYGREFSRNFPGHDMGQTGRNWGDRRQDRDFAGSMRAGETGAEMGGDRSSAYGGSRYGATGYGGRSGMGYGGGASGPPTRRPSEYDQYTGMTSEPGFGAGYGAAGPRRTGGGYGYGGPHDWGGRDDNERGFWDKATDEVSSWFGDEDAERRREMDRGHTGRGPRNYARSDSRIHEDVCDRLTENPMIDASEVEVSVSDREVTLSGIVHSREEKRRAEDLAEDVSGVTHVQNNLRVQRREPGSHVQSTLDSFSHATAGGFAEKGGSTMSSRTTSESGTTGAGSSPTASGTASDTKKTTGSSPGVMRSDPSTSSTKGA